MPAKEIPRDWIGLACEAIYLTVGRTPNANKETVVAAIKLSASFSDAEVDAIFRHLVANGYLRDNEGAHLSGTGLREEGVLEACEWRAGRYAQRILLAKVSLDLERLLGHTGL